MGGVAVPSFQVNVDAVTPGVLFHDADDLRKEHLLRPVCVVPQGAEDAVRPVIRHRQQPLDMGPFVDVGEHIRNRHAALVNLPGGPHLKGEQPDLADAVAVVPRASYIRALPMNVHTMICLPFSVSIRSAHLHPAFPASQTAPSLFSLPGASPYAWNPRRRCTDKSPLFSPGFHFWCIPV